LNSAQADAFYRSLSDRTVQYGERPLDPGRRVAIEVSPDYLATKPGQAALIVTADLLSRMVRQVNLAFPDAAFHAAFGGPFRGSLHDGLIGRMKAVAPPGGFVAEPITQADYVVRLGSDGRRWVAHGVDWSVYVGPGPSPLAPPQTDNIFGASHAAITAVAQLFGGRFPDMIEPRLADLLTLTSAAGANPIFAPAGSELGTIWFVGCGSVGSAIAYFLALAGYRFTAVLFDKDIVKIENLDRSPIFTFDDQTHPKVESVARFLRQFGIAAEPEPHWLDESAVWKGRQAGTPDIIVAAANERDVRYQIESQFPAIQIYGTTGKDWQANIFRHVPVDPCSCCAFPPAAHRETGCAEGEAPSPIAAEKTVDAALPFLSFGAGLLAAAEISKLVLPGFPFSGSRGFFTPLAEEILYTRPFKRRDECVCAGRNRTVHRKMVAGTRYAPLYHLDPAVEV